MVGIGIPCSRKEEAHEIIYFRNRSHGGAGIFGSGLLLYSNHWREPVDLIHIGTFHASQKRAGISRKALHVPALTFGVNGIEGQGAFAATAESRDHHYFVARNLEIYVFEIMLSGTKNFNTFFLKGRDLAHEVRKFTIR